MPYTLKKETLTYWGRARDGWTVCDDKGITWGHYELISEGEARIAELIRRRTAPTRPASARHSWSDAENQRGNHPLGDIVESANGYTVYEDAAFDGGQVQIWDKS